jgi:hypothetical protein
MKLEISVEWDPKVKRDSSKWFGVEHFVVDGHTYQELISFLGTHDNFSKQEKKDALKLCFGYRGSPPPPYDRATLEKFLVEPLWTDLSSPALWARLMAEAFSKDVPAFVEARGTENRNTCVLTGLATAVGHPLFPSVQAYMTQMDRRHNA